jgi:hypothetical protein
LTPLFFNVFDATFFKSGKSGKSGKSRKSGIKKEQVSSMTLFKRVPKSSDSVWCITRDELSAFLTEDEKEALHAKLNRMYQAGFKDFDVNSPLFCSIPYTFCFYIQGLFDSKLGWPSHESMPAIIDAITSTVKIDKTEQGWCLWNVCNDPTKPKGGFMRRLIDMIHRSAPLHTRFYLHVAYANAFFERAVRMYLEKGYRYIIPTEYHDIAVTMELRTSKRTIRVLQSWEEFTQHVENYKRLF